LTNWHKKKRGKKQATAFKHFKKKQSRAKNNITKSPGREGKGRGVDQENTTIRIIRSETEMRQLTLGRRKKNEKKRETKKGEEKTEWLRT